MDTRRCPRCQKLLRNDAQSCNRCGLAFATEKSSHKRLEHKTNPTLFSSQPTNPPASPHRAGHYSGLHPEDQPFQSSFFLRVQRPAGQNPPGANAYALLNEADDTKENAPQPPHWQEDTESTYSASIDRSLADFSTVPSRRSPETPIPASPELIATEDSLVQSQQWSEATSHVIRERDPRSLKKLIFPSTRRSPRMVPILLSAALICFLVASSLLAFLLLSKGPSHAGKPRLMALPGELRVGDMVQLLGSGFKAHDALTLTRDTHTALFDARGGLLRPTTDAQGNFQVTLPITGTWSIGVHVLQAGTGNLTASTVLTIQTALAGPPRLQLGVSHLNLGAGNPGTLSQEDVTLTNAGGGQVIWSAQSSVAWLSLTPSGGTFAGNALVHFTVNRTNLTPQAYLGQVVFTQKGGNPQVLYVSMIVNTASTNLVLSTASLVFAGTPVQSPADQTIVLQNTGNQALNWTSGVTANGTDWLSVTPDNGLLDAHTSAMLAVRANTAGMAVGTYQGSVSFSYAGGPLQQVSVTLTVNAPPQPVIHLAPQSLSFVTNQGFNPAPQSFTITNTGNAPLNWTIHADSNGMNYLAISPIKGSLSPGENTTVSITPLLGNVNGTISSTLTVLDSDAGSNVPTQQEAVNVAITSEPVINVVQGNLEFDDPSTPTVSSELAIFSNAGSLPLHWTLVERAPVPWLSFDATSGTVAPGDLGFITAICTSSGMKPGTYTATLTLQDTDAHTVVASQTITITLIVSSQA